MNMTRRSTWIPVMLLMLVLAACGQSAASTTANNASSTPGPTATTAPSPQTRIAAEPSIAPSAAASPTTGSIALPSATPLPAALPASGSAIDAIGAAFQASVAATSYRVVSTLTSGDTSSIAQTFEIMLPDRLRRTMDINGTISESIIIGATTYSQANGGEWMKSEDPVGMIDILKQIGGDAETIDQVKKNITDAKVIGPDMLDGKPMTVYQYELTFKVNDAGDESSSVTTIWVGADSLPYKLESASSTNLAGTATTSRLVNIYSDYNADFNINAPIP